MLHEAGYQAEARPTRPHAPKVQRFERARPNQLWQTDLFTFVLKRQNRRLYLVAFLDDHSRFVVGYGLHASASGGLVLEEQTAETVQTVYAQLFAEHGPPLVLKSYNGGPFRDERTKQLLAEHLVVPLYNPRRRPAYNGGVERANGQLAGYQEALAAFRGRAGAPTCEDAASARTLANELARPEGWQGPTAGQLWQRRVPLSDGERDAFLRELDQRRIQARTDLNLPPEAPLAHYPQAAVDRRAVRDTLVSQVAGPARHSAAAWRAYSCRAPGFKKRSVAGACSWRRG